jgi:hypothetical protein
MSYFIDLTLNRGLFRMRIDNNVGCGIPSCPVDLGPNCAYLFIMAFSSPTLTFHSFVLRPGGTERPLRRERVPRWVQERVLGGCAGWQRWYVLSYLMSGRILLNSEPPPGNSPNCCSGSHNTAATCPPSGVTNYHYFSAYISVLIPTQTLTPRPSEDNCPNAYAYAYDESSGTALWTCPTSKNAAYTITFCP